MKRRLYKHQKNAIAYCLRVSHPALFMQMRLGKTLTIIRRVKLMPIDQPKVLVVLDRFSAVGGWIDDLTQEDEKFIVLMGVKEKRLKMLKNSMGIDWFIINKEGLLSIGAIASLPWDAVIADESTFLKNPKAKITKFMLTNFRKAKLRAIMTGTPNPESDLEFATQMIFLNGSFCGCRDYWKFRAKYFEPGTWGFKWNYKSGARAIVEKELSDKAFILSRKDAGMDCKKVIENRYLKFSPEVQKMYDDIEKNYALQLHTSDIDIKTIWATERYIWLRRLCGGWFGKERLVWNGKALEIVNLMEGELKNEKVIVWFNFNLEIKTVMAALTACIRSLRYECITAQTKPATREVYRREFNKGPVQLLLIQQKVAQTGMDLSGADTAIYYSEPVSLFAKQQTEDRNLDIKKTWPLLYINLLVENTTDIDNHQALALKSLRSDLTLSSILRKKLLARRNQNV